MKSKLFVPNKNVGFDYGESKIYTVSDGIYKEFAFNISQAKRRRKKERLVYLEQYEMLKQYYPEIRYFVELVRNWYIQGYVMEEINYKSLDSSRISYEKKVESLRKIREILDLFRSIGLHYYDLHLGNVCLNENGLPIFMDIDSILYADETKPDIAPFGLREYKRSGGKLDEEFQRIKFNDLTKKALWLNDGRDFEYDEVGTEMIEAEDERYELNGPFSHEYLIDHVLKKTH